jgi:hypothetical protein
MALCLLSLAGLDIVPMVRDTVEQCEQGLGLVI